MRFRQFPGEYIPFDITYLFHKTLQTINQHYGILILVYLLYIPGYRNLGAAALFFVRLKISHGYLWLSGKQYL